MNGQRKNDDSMKDRPGTDGTNADAEDTEILSAPAQDAAAGPDAGPEPSAPRRGRGRTALIAAGAVVAVLAVGGIGAGIALAVDDDDDTAAVEPVSADGSDADRDGSDASTDDIDDGSGGSSGSDAAGSGRSDEDGSSDDVATDADALVSAIDSAVGAVDGTGATSIEVGRTGWEVDVTLPDGTESEVFVSADGTTTVTDERDRADSDPVLDTAEIASIVDAAVGYAGGGSVSEIATDDDAGRAYEVTVDLGGGAEAEMDLASDLSLVELDD